jgi:hypothetical protein
MSDHQSPPTQPPFPGHAPFWQPPTPPPAPKWARKQILIPAAILILFLGVGIGSSDDGTQKASAKPQPTVTVTKTAEAKAGTLKKADPQPTVTVTKTVKPKASTKPKPKPKKTAAPADKVVFKVWGSAPSGVDITYGSDSDNIEGRGLPMTKTLTLKDDAMYYNVTAQLEGGGDIHCSVTVDGKTKKGHAVGGYNICSAQLSGGLFGGWN